MQRITFTITGNHKSRTGNPVPKLKMTGNQHWTPKAREYVEWKTHVVTALVEAYKNNLEFVQNYQRYSKPIILGPLQSAMMFLDIHWSNKAHGDPENIFGAIADALFHNDKRLDPIVVSRMTGKRSELGKPQGYVEVDLYIFADAKEKEKFIKKVIKK